MASLKKNFLYSAIFTFSNLLFPIITFPYAARILGPEGIGKVQFVNTFAQYFVLIALLGVPIYGIREVAKCRHNPQALKALFTQLVTINGICSVFLLVIYALIVFLVPGMRTDADFYAVAVVSLVFSFSTIDWFFSGLENYRLIAIRSLVVRLIAIVLLFALVKTKDDALYYLGILIGCIVFSNLWNIYSAWPYFSVSTLSKKRLTKHLKPLFYIFSTSAAISVYAVSDILILGIFKDFQDVGYYTSATKLDKVTIPIVITLGTVLIPRISKSFLTNDLDVVKKLSELSLEFVILLSIPITAGLIALAPELVILFSGEDFRPAIFTMQIFAPVVIVIGLSNVWAIQVLTPAGKDKQVTFSVFLGLILSLSLNFILIPRYSYVGAAISNLAAEFLVMLSFAYFANQVIKIRVKKNIVIESVCISLLFIPITYGIRTQLAGNDILICVLSMLLCASIYLGSQLFLFKNKLLLQQFHSIVRREDKR